MNMGEIWIREFQSSLAASTGQRTINTAQRLANCRRDVSFTLLALTIEPAAAERVGVEMQTVGTATEVVAHTTSE